jgi:hypothetical protein
MPRNRVVALHIFHQYKKNNMKHLLVYPLLLFVLWGNAQEKLWTESDRQYQLQNLRRTRDLLVKETEGLSDAQWHFKESAERWSIAEIVEHLALWEIIFARETNLALRSTPNPALSQASRPDSSYLTFIMEEKHHQSPGYSRPTGFIKGKDNLTFFLSRNGETLKFVEGTTADLKAFYEPVGGGVFRNVHQIHLVQWGHIDRHLRQIKKVKEHPGFPKS